jgi:hypothetical protein
MGANSIAVRFLHRSATQRRAPVAPVRRTRHSPVTRHLPPVTRHLPPGTRHPAPVAPTPCAQAYSYFRVVQTSSVKESEQALALKAQADEQLKVDAAKHARSRLIRMVRARALCACVSVCA